MTKQTLPFLTDVKSGYSRKVSMREHGGLQYEMADITQELITKAVPPEHVATVAATTYARCVAVVEARIKKLDLQAEEVGSSKPKTGIELDKQEMDEIIEIFNDITIAKSMKALRYCAQEVKKFAPSLKKAQIKFLRSHYKERLRVLKK